MSTPKRRYNEGDQVLIKAKGTAWDGHRATVRCVAKYELTEYWVSLEGRSLTACYREYELRPFGVIDRLARIETP